MRGRIILRITDKTRRTVAGFIAFFVVAAMIASMVLMALGSQ